MATMESAERWRHHGQMSEPGPGPLTFDGLPADIGGLCRVVQGVLLHSDWIGAYGVSEAEFGTVSRETLPLSGRLRQIADLDGSALTTERAPDRRAVGTCRDYALMLCGMLRQQRVPARVRCGFAAYFKREWEDHWICEYWRDGRWRRTDAQLDRIIAPRLGIGFDLTDLPADMFVTAGEAWRCCRSGEADPMAFAHGQQANGLWFIRVNVVRDHHSVNGRETSDWDTWRQATSVHHSLSEAECTATDEMAAHPERPTAGPPPPWFAGKVS